jgi:hypothetical protein
VGISLFLSLVGRVTRFERGRIARLGHDHFSSSDGPDRGWLTGIHPEPGPGFHQPFQPGADKLGPRTGHSPGYLGIDHADRLERELQQSAGSGLGQVEGGHADAHAHVE